MTEILDGITEGTLEGDPLVELTDALGDALTPAGILNTLGKSGATEDVLNRVEDLVVEGVPPGILVRIAKGALRDGLSDSEITALLDELAAGADGDAWGQLANDVTDQGVYQYQDQEQNQNESGGQTLEPQLETEENQHGNANGTKNDDKNAGKKDSSKGQGNKKG